ncbi:hypothetical protein, partial [Rhodoblastus sp.]|uniref:hypothetical protein n=1 Tax=Rhodoblastus sp. TaxID=1962975 RepID=UPI00260653A6
VDRLPQSLPALLRRRQVNGVHSGIGASTCDRLISSKNLLTSLMMADVLYIVPLILKIISF